MSLPSFNLNIKNELQHRKCLAGCLAWKQPTMTHPELSILWTLRLSSNRLKPLKLTVMDNSFCFAVSCHLLTVILILPGGIKKSTENLCYLCINLIMYTVGTSIACTVLYTVFSLFTVFVFQLFKMLGNTGMVAKATKFLYLEDES